MKFLVNATPKEMQITPEMGATIYAAARQWMESRLADGAVECHYVFPEGGGFAIVNAASHEAVADMLLSFPLNGTVDWDVRPLCDWHAMYGKWIKMFQKMTG